MFIPNKKYCNSILTYHTDEDGDFIRCYSPIHLCDIWIFKDILLECIIVGDDGDRHLRIKRDDQGAEFLVPKNSLELYSVDFPDFPELHLENHVDYECINGNYNEIGDVIDWYTGEVKLYPDAKLGDGATICPGIFNKIKDTLEKCGFKITVSNYI